MSQHSNLPQLPTEVSPDGREIWDWAANAAPSAQPSIEHEPGDVSKKAPEANMSTAPARIYLDIGDRFALERVQDGTLPWDKLAEVTWSADNATGHGIEYVRADVAVPPAAPAPCATREMAPATTQAQEAAGLSDKQIEALLDAPEVPAEDSGLNTYYNREQVIEHMQEAAILAACIVTKSAAPTQPQPEHEPSPHVANTVDCGHEAGSNEAFERWYAQYHEDACVMYGGLSGNPKDVAHDAWDSALAYPAAPPTAPVEAVTAQGDEVIPPRPAGYNDASTDPGSPLQRWGKPRHEGAKLLLQPLDDGYWTPWHIANEMLRSAQSGDEAQLLADAERWRTLLTMRKDLVAGIVQRHDLADRYKPGPWTLQEEVDAVRAAREAMGGVES